MLAGSGGYEDAGVYQISAEQALVQTVDFFPPIVDDPRWFGRIAAANALSDVFAMGGQVSTALNIVGWPKELDIDVLGEVMAGGQEKVLEAGGVLVGGHSVTTPSVLYGLSVTGLVHPERFWRNSGAREGDALILTKPLGIGILSSAIKKGLCPEELVEPALQQMAQLNKAAADGLQGMAVHAATDVTGFGIAGHGKEMADGAGLTLELHTGQLPLFERALDFAREGLVSGGSKRGQEAMAGGFEIQGEVEESLVGLCFDAETSGGLLLSVSESLVDEACTRLREAGALCADRVGSFVARGDVSLRLKT